METLVLMAVIAALVAIERVPWLRLAPARVIRPFFATDVVYLATGAVALGLVLRAQASRWAGAAGLAPAAIPFPLLALLALVLYDLGAYLAHLLLHRIQALWKLHKVHHSSRTLDWLATFRAHILEHALRHLLSPVLLILVGFPLTAVGVAAAIYGVWAAFGHANVRLSLPWLEPVLITPRLHRLHHVPDTGERNLGTVFSLWDRLRGSLLADTSACAEPLGVPGEIDSYPQSWLPQLVEPLRGVGGREGSSHR
jgi:sterol desaturase/sphingolipid hydroxylase (fatty acid hydroxylase superfamily)